MELKAYSIHIACGSWDSTTYLILAPDFERAKAILKKETGFDYDTSKKFGYSTVTFKYWEERPLVKGVLNVEAEWLG
jgi:hypothetical protein